MSKHKRFIDTPITVEIEKALTAISFIEDGMNSCPLGEYMFQSLFLRMTGFQEQKLKCINWELANEDFGYRRALLKNEDRLGEYSRLDDKQAVYKRLTQYLILETGRDVDCLINKPQIAKEAKKDIVDIFKNTRFQFWSEHHYENLKNENNLFQVGHFATNTLLTEPLSSLYEQLYNDRNRWAHNTLSYQEDMPTLRLLSEVKEGSHNYFAYFTLLNLIDKIFVGLYKQFESLLESRSYD